MIEPIHKQRDVDTQHIPIDTLQRIQRIVLEETQGGRTIIRNLVSIMNGDDPDGKPSHRSSPRASCSDSASRKPEKLWAVQDISAMPLRSMTMKRRTDHIPHSSHTALNTRR